MKTRYLTAICILTFLATLAPTLLAGSPATVGFRLKFYAIRAEDDGVGGNGVDMYLGWLVSGPNQSFGGTCDVAGGLKTSNGTGEHKNVHQRNDALCTIQIPDGAAVVIRFNMIESDETTDEIKKTFADAHPPKFGEGARKLDISPEDAAELFSGSYKPLLRLLTGKNTDDDYGHWTLLLTNSDGKVHVTLKEADKGCTANFQATTFPIDGQWKDLTGLNFKDREENPENDLGAQIEIMAK